MSDADDPVRLLDDPGTSNELRSLLAAGRSDALDRAAAVRVQTRVHDRLAAPSVSRRWWGVGAGTAVVIGWLALRSPASDAAPEPTTVAPASMVEDPAPQHVAPAVVPEVRAPIAAVPIERPVTPARAKEPRRATAPPAAPATPPASASEEARLLLAARRALASDPTAALAKTAEHERRFATGTLTEERELVAVRALVALDRRADAQARADRFVERFPDSVHRAALERALQ